MVLIVRTYSSMRVIKRGALEQFWRIYPDAQANLESWYGVMRKAVWKTPAEMKQIYPSADLVGRRTVFNICGNKYRLIARVNYQTQRVFVLYLLTHAEYDKGTWKQ
jgi:mRNA interferase HigB